MNPNQNRGVTDQRRVAGVIRALLFCLLVPFVVLFMIAYSLWSTGERPRSEGHPGGGEGFTSAVANVNVRKHRAVFSSFEDEETLDNFYSEPLQKRSSARSESLKRRAVRQAKLAALAVEDEPELLVPLSANDLADIDGVEYEMKVEKGALMQEIRELTREEREEVMQKWHEQTYEQRLAVNRLKNQKFLQENFPHRYESNHRDNIQHESTTK